MLLVLFVVATIGISSCSKWVKCSYWNNFASEICQGVNQTNSEYQEAFDELQDDGCDCK